jgi:hypothetical protein
LVSFSTFDFILEAIRAELVSYRPVLRPLDDMMDNTTSSAVEPQSHMEDFGCSGMVLKSPFLSLDWDLIHRGQTNRAIDKYRKYWPLFKRKKKSSSAAFCLNLAAAPFGGIAGYQRNRQDSVVARSNNRLARGGKKRMALAVTVTLRYHAI